MRKIKLKIKIFDIKNIGLSPDAEKVVVEKRFRKLKNRLREFLLDQNIGKYKIVVLTDQFDAKNYDLLCTVGHLFLVAPKVIRYGGKFF